MISLFHTRHDEQHRIGIDAFNKKYSVDLWTLAAEFARRSPDWDARIVEAGRPAEIGAG